MSFHKEIIKLYFLHIPSSWVKNQHPGLHFCLGWRQPLTWKPLFGIIFNSSPLLCYVKNMEKTGTHYVNNNEEQNATFRQISINCYLNAIGGMFNVLCAPSIAPDFSWGLYQISRMYGIRENICQAHCKDI